MAYEPQYIDYEVGDWRSLPRKDRASCRDHRLNIRVTGSEYEMVNENARALGVTMSDYVVCKALGIERRVSVEDTI